MSAWTREPPTEPGFYVVCDPRRGPIPRRLFDQGHQLSIGVIEENGHPDTGSNWWWWTQRLELPEFPERAEREGSADA